VAGELMPVAAWSMRSPHHPVAACRTNFSTVRSNVCVWKGRWQYEVQLGSAGILQVGAARWRRARP
jgi:Kip1 ubiquitination-promoting complex protein 1